MHYELYIDLFFLVNFFMDYLLLLLVGKILKYRIRHLKVALGAFLGAVLSCIVIVFFRGRMWRLSLFHGVINFIMLKAGYEIKEKRNLLKGWIISYVSAFLMGGILNAFQPYLRTGVIFVLFAMGGYYLCCKIWDLSGYLRRSQGGSCKVMLYQNDRMCQLYAIIDTGNRLRDPMTGRPVHIIDREMAGKLGYTDLGKERVITYQSVGTKNGTMPLLIMERLCCQVGQEEKWVEKPLVAVSENQKFSGVYDMILNPDDL